MIVFHWLNVRFLLLLLLLLKNQEERVGVGEFGTCGGGRDVENSFPPVCVVLSRYFLIGFRCYFSNLPLDF